MNACIHAAAAESNYPDLVAGTFFPFSPPREKKKKVAATKTGRFAEPGGLELGLGIGSD
jgi:hypothetical protein